MTAFLNLAGFTLIVGGAVLGLMSLAERYPRFTAWAQRLLDTPRRDDEDAR